MPRKGGAPPPVAARKKKKPVPPPAEHTKLAKQPKQASFQAMLDVVSLAWDTLGTVPTYSKQECETEVAAWLSGMPLLYTTVLSMRCCGGVRACACSGSSFSMPQSFLSVFFISFTTL